MRLPRAKILVIRQLPQLGELVPVRFAHGDGRADLNRNGTGDTPHVLNEENQDNYPLIKSHIDVNRARDIPSF